jgi:hypothetical protein
VVYSPYRSKYTKILGIFLEIFHIQVVFNRFYVYNAIFVLLPAYWGVPASKNMSGYGWAMAKYKYIYI